MTSFPSAVTHGFVALMFPKDWLRTVQRFVQNGRTQAHAFHGQYGVPLELCRLLVRAGKLCARWIGCLNLAGLSRERPRIGGGKRKRHTYKRAKVLRSPQMPSSASPRCDVGTTRKARLAIQGESVRARSLDSAAPRIVPCLRVSLVLRLAEFAWMSKGARASSNRWIGLERPATLQPLGLHERRR
jgi:hypothetical protein